MPVTYYDEYGELLSRVVEIGGILPRNINSQTALQIGINAGLNLEAMKQNAEDNLIKLLNFLGYSANASNLESSLQELNNKIKEFHSTTSKLNGE